MKYLYNADNKKIEDTIKELEQDLKFYQDALKVWKQVKPATDKLKDYTRYRGMNVNIPEMVTNVIKDVEGIIQVIQNRIKGWKKELEK